MTTALPRLRRSRNRLLAALTAAGLSAFLSVAHAADAAAGAAAPAAAAPSTNAMTNLVNLLVQQGVITQPQGTALIAQAEADAAAATEAAAQAARQAALAHAPGGAVASSAPDTPAGAFPVSSTTPDGAIRVTYVPESVREQLREDIRQDVMKQAREENWADPREVPAWTKKLRLTGDLRFRYEGAWFPSGNDTTGYPDFNAVNRGSPYNQSTANTVLPPMTNVDQDRDRLRLRARLALDADLGEGFSAGVRLATGSDDSPVSTNQSMGSDGLGSKYALWLDRGFLKYDVPGLTDSKLAFTVGRFENPFFATDLIWDDDLGFDGVMAQGSRRMGRLKPFATLGLFPVYNTSFNFSSNQPEKFKSDDRWLYGVQLGTDIELAKDLSLKVAVAYYDYAKIAGKLSSPIDSPDVAGDTDSRRPAFAQKGNTYMALRDNTYYTDPTSPWYQQNLQYYGLATPFSELALTARLDFRRFDPVHLSLDFEFVKNLSYDEGRINSAGAQNNLRPGPSGLVDGGDTGYLARLTVGDPVLEKRWDWQASIAYKYLETDAVVDGFTDSDFGLGGTNLKGFILGASVGLSRNVSGRVRWLSADNVSGASYSSDVFQFDINAKF
ncbi:hypothetical protein OPIT5_08940 [Opitutaceae bacterium TAV5]|nr:hypothetical protein OPIT5_08940 [Opitutaceae bacterium TAV5]